MAGSERHGLSMGFVSFRESSNLKDLNPLTQLCCDISHEQTAKKLYIVDKILLLESISAIRV